MSYSRRSRYSRFPSPYKRSRSVSRSLSRSRSRSRSAESDVENPGNNLYVTGLSPRITKRELEKHFASEGNVIDVHLVVDPWTRESRGFGFVTMASNDEAERCIKYLDRSVLEGRVIMVEKAKRRRGRTPTPGRYLGLRTIRVRGRTPCCSPRRSPSYSPYSRSQSRSPSYSSDRSRSRSYSPRHRRRDRSYSPEDCYSRRRDRSYSPYDSRYDSADDRYYRRHRCRSVSLSPTPPWSRRGSGRSYSRSFSPKRRTSSRRSYSRSTSPVDRRSRRSYSRSISPPLRKSLKSSGQGRSKDSYTCSRSASPTSRSVSRSVTPRSNSSS
ncbi:hypothetical protein REPUB_Repub11eG0153800 [Reevesia pubescens]